MSNPEVVTNQEWVGFDKEKYLKEEILKPQHSALLVVDVQNDFCDSKGFFATKLNKDVSQMASIVPHVKGLIDVAHNARVPVIFTQGFEDVRFRKPGPDQWRAMKWGESNDNPESINSKKGTFGAEFYILKPEERDIVIEKHKWSAFNGKDNMGRSLKEILDGLGIKTLVVTGVVAETCIETTIRDAYDQDYFVVIPRDTIGSDHPEQLKIRMEYWAEGHVGDVVEEEDIKESWPPVKDKN